MEGGARASPSTGLTRTQRCKEGPNVDGSPLSRGSMRLVAVAIVATLVCVLVWRAAPWRAPAGATPPNAPAIPAVGDARSQEDMASFRKSQRAMEAELASLRAQLARIESAGAAVTDTTEPEPERRPETPEEMASAEDAQERRLIAALDAESVDPRWSGEAEARLMDSFAPAAPRGVRIERATCRLSFCRVDIDGSAAAPDTDVPMALMGLMPWDAQGFFRESDDTPGTGSLFVTRAGSVKFGDAPAPVSSPLDRRPVLFAHGRS